MGIYAAIGGAAGCHALSTAFYKRVERDAVLRPLFPSTFKCAIDEFAAFLVQFLGGEAEATQKRWWLSLRESHARFRLGPRERDSWLRAMKETLEDDAAIPDGQARRDLLEFFRHSSAHVVNTGEVPGVDPIHGELAELWDEQLALDEAVALGQAPESAALQARFARSPAVHASFVALALRSKNAALRDYAVGQIQAHPSLVDERYSGSRTLLHDAAAVGDPALVDLLLSLGAGRTADADLARSPLYCVANECNAPGASQVVHLLLRRSAARVNAVHGAKRCTAIHMAARRGNVDVIAALLDEGADIEARDSAGDTPLRRAVNCDKLEAAKLLLARGADRNSVGSKRLTPALAARSSRMKELF